MLQEMEAVDLPEGNVEYLQEMGIELERDWDLSLTSEEVLEEGGSGCTARTVADSD